eukprot:jgi/Astpho2/7239/Aster-01547
MRYVAALVLLGVLDAIWIGVIAKYIFRLDYFGVINSIQNAPAAERPAGFLAYLSMAYAAAFMCNNALEAAQVGFVIYSIVDFTNYFMFQGWTAKVALLDMCWGTSVYAITGAALSYLPQTCQ